MEQELQKALEVLKNGGVIIYPTDTVWGLGCDATNSKAIEKLIEIKGKQANNGLIVLVDKDINLNKYVDEVPEVAWEIIEVSDKPITIIYDKVKGIAAQCIAPDGSAAIRVVNDEFCKKLIYKLGKPIVSTSANFSGQPTPANFLEVNKDLQQKVDYVVNWRQNEKTQAAASSIIKISNSGSFKIIRK
ncbi:MAG: L-threonylcarbamoyladenylate synthase [Bacteroidota bacterium]